MCVQPSAIATLKGTASNTAASTNLKPLQASLKTERQGYCRPTRAAAECKALCGRITRCQACLPYAAKTVKMCAQCMLNSTVAFSGTRTQHPGQQQMQADMHASQTAHAFQIYSHGQNLLAGSMIKLAPADSWALCVSTVHKSRAVTCAQQGRQQCEAHWRRL